ncbi:Hypothetical predicted protein, partial [Pelobates cultripes]
HNLMGNKKKSGASLNTPEPGKTRASSNPDKYFRDTVKVLGENMEDSQGAPSSPCSQRARSPATSERSGDTSRSDLKEILLNLPSKDDIAAMMAKLESSVQDKLTTLTTDI